MEHWRIDKKCYGTFGLKASNNEFVKDWLDRRLDIVSFIDFFKPLEKKILGKDTILEGLENGEFDK